MGYALEKRIIDQKIKTAKTAVVLAVALLCCAGLIFSAYYPPDSWKYYFQLPQTGVRADGELRMHFLDVGQGDATIIELPDGKTMLIDGGNGETSTADTVLRYLNALKIDELDYLLVTHADSDHCGSLDTVLKYNSVKQAFVPNAEETVNAEYASFYSALLDEGCEIIYADNSIRLSVYAGEYQYKLCFLSPSAYGAEEKIPEEESNENSAVVWLDYHGVSTLFTGDAPKSTEEKLQFNDGIGLFDNMEVELDSTEILKVAHHGSADSTGAEFLGYLHAQTAVISCGVDNPYGHPMSETLNALTANGTDIYRTDQHGSIIVSIPKKENKWTVQTYGKT